MSLQQRRLNYEPKDKDAADPREQGTVMKHHLPDAPDQAAS